MTGGIKRLLVGKPLRSTEIQEQRLGNFAALAVFASDALSSVAYATEEILLALVLAGTAFLHLTLPLSVAIVILLLIVAVSYRQTIHAYPTGGGAYTVAKENLGTLPSLVAGGALLIDYILTVAVSVAAGVAAITSAFPSLYHGRVWLCLAAVGVVTWGNLRGVRESGKLFGGPAYGFIFAMGLLIVGGLFKYAFGSTPEAYTVSVDVVTTAQPLTLFLLLRAFASGCTAMTGIEAISNGVTAFRAPEDHNAARVLRWLTMILGAIFLGVSFLAWLFRIVPAERETVVSQLAHYVFGDNILYIFIQGATAAILILAANTSFADFPRLSSLMAKDSYLPRQLQSYGDRLVFSNGILLLAAAACFLLWEFKGNTHGLIPLYAVGVFLSFTISQTGMIFHHLKIREPNWKRNLMLNAIGAVATAVVLIAVLLAKFTHGAWIVCVALPLFVMMFFSIYRHYQEAARQLRVDLSVSPRKLKNTVIVPVAGIHKGVVHAIEYARTLSKNVRAVTVALNDTAAQELKEQWEKWEKQVPLVILSTPYRSLTEPLLEYIQKVDAEDPDDLITVIIPSFIPARWWHHFLHNQSSIQLQAALRGMRNVVVTSVRIHLDR